MRFSINSDSGAGISERWMASAEPDTKSNDIRGIKALTRNPSIIRLTIRNIKLPRFMISLDRGRSLEYKECSAQGLQYFSMVS